MPAACGSLAAHCETTEARRCSLRFARQGATAICAARARIVFRHHGNDVREHGRARSPGSDKFLRPSAARPGDRSAPIVAKSLSSKFRRVSPLLLRTANSAAAGGSVSLHWVTIGLRAFWRVAPAGKFLRPAQGGLQIGVRQLIARSIGPRPPASCRRAGRRRNRPRRSGRSRPAGEHVLYRAASCFAGRELLASRRARRRGRSVPIAAPGWRSPDRARGPAAGLR